jgi:uncharacterized protein
MDTFLKAAANLASADASTVDFLTAEQAVQALEGRLGRVYARQRLGIERDNEARALRRRGMRITNFIIEGILRTSGTYWHGHGNAAKVRVCHNEVWSARLPAAFDGLIILHLSDLHADMSQRAMVEAARLVRDLNYDLCVLTGDYRGKTFGPFQPCLRHMFPLVEALKGDVYGVLGNHDSVLMVPDLERLGIRMLLNEHVVIERDAESLFLAGIDDAHFYRVDNIEKVSADVHRHAFSILLSHTPEIYRQASHAGYDLMLAGHTHGGQICLPGRTPIILRSKLPRSMGGGVWKYHEMAGYTSVGAGACGVPVRFNCPPEITLHRLRRVY